MRIVRSEVTRGAKRGSYVERISNFLDTLDPVQMANAFAKAVKGGRSAYLAGPMVVQEAAVSSTPEIGRPFASDSSQSAGPAFRAGLAPR